MRYEEYEAEAEAAAPERLQVEQLAREAGTAPWLLAAARVRFSWAEGQEVTRDEYAEAIRAAASIRIG